MGIHRSHKRIFQRQDAKYDLENADYCTRTFLVARKKSLQLRFTLKLKNFYEGQHNHLPKMKPSEEQTDVLRCTIVNFSKASAVARAAMTRYCYVFPIHIPGLDSLYMNGTT